MAHHNKNQGMRRKWRIKRQRRLKKKRREAKKKAT